MTLLFTLSVLLIAYHYLLYPAAVILLAKLRPRPSRAPALAGIPDAAWPSITLLIAAYNEERVIAAKIENTLALDYPAGRMQVMVVSDGSSDATARIVDGYAGRGVISLHRPERRGKTAALNRGVAAARSDLIVFSDANNPFDRDALRQLARHFLDPEVGGVCGRKAILETAGRESSAGDSLYWRYESTIKKAESDLWTITNADGEIFAIRRALYRPVAEHLINDDAAITLDILDADYRVLYEPAAISREEASLRIEDDFVVKVRMVSGGFQTLTNTGTRLWLPHDLIGLAFFSHKVLRWLMPWLLVICLTTSTALASRHAWIAGFALLQWMFYAFAGLGWWLRRRQPMAAVLYFPFYFSTMNAAAAFGLIRFLNRGQTTLWRKAER